MQATQSAQFKAFPAEDNNLSGFTLIQLFSSILTKKRNCSLHLTCKTSCHGKQNTNHI